MKKFEIKILMNQDVGDLYLGARDMCLDGWEPVNITTSMSNIEGQWFTTYCLLLKREIC